MRKLNFFLIGAPKCGTTSLYNWLKTHPQIFLSAEKEPNYWNFDHQNRIVKNFEEYESLFEEATDEHLIVGECSTRYLVSEEAVSHILEYNPEAVFVVLLRNPIEAVCSWHNHLIFNGMENVKSFEKAWSLQERRKKTGKPLSILNKEPKMLYYGEMYALGKQLKRLYEKVPKERVHLIFFEDIKNHSSKVYREILQFCKLDDDQKRDFEVFNPSKIRRYRMFFEILLRKMANFERPHFTKKIIKSFGSKKCFGFLIDKNSRRKKWSPSSEKMKRKLVNYYREEIKLISVLSGRDLRHWLQ